MSASDAAALGQLLILRLHDARWSGRLERMLRKLQPSGVLFFPECFRTPGQTAELLHKVAQALNSLPFLAITEEGGSVNPLKALLPPLPAPRVLAGRGPAAVRRSAELIGAGLRLLGFNVNLAPRLDLSNPNVKPALDAQTFSADPKLVTECGRAFIDGLSKHKILACAKHFPGRDAPEYNENGLPVVGKTMAELWREDLLPFREALARLPLMRLSNAAYKAYDFDVPQPGALSSKVVHDLLRVKLGYRGLAIADPWELLREGSPQRVRQQDLSMNLQVFLLSIKAGCDLQVVSSIPKIPERLLAAMQQEIESGSLTQERVREALGRIRTVKKGLRRPSGKLPVRSFDRLAREFEEFGQRIGGGGKVEA